MDSVCGASLAMMDAGVPIKGSVAGIALGLVKEAGKPRWDWQPEPVNEALNARVAALAEARLSDAYRITDKQERYAQVDVIKSETIATLLAEDETLDLV